MTTVVRRMVGALSARGHAVAVVAPRYPDPGPPGAALELRIPSVAFPPYPAIRLSTPALRRISRFLDQFAPDLLHVATEGPLGLAGRHYARTRGLPLVTSFHTDFPRYTRDYGVPRLEPVVWRWLTWFHSPARLIHTPGEFIQRQLVSRGLDQTVVWGRGVDVEFFHPGRRSEGKRRSLGVTNGTPIILHVGRLAPEKNIAVLVESWIAARDALGNRARFVVAGSGPMGDLISQRAPWIERLGFLDPADLADLYASSDICVLPSTTETCGLVSLEAMASGVPVIAADAGGLRESVRDMHNGIIVPPDDAGALSAAIVRLAMETPLRRRLACGARETALARDARTEDDVLVDQYRMLIGPREAPACTAA